VYLNQLTILVSSSYHTHLHNQGIPYIKFKEKKMYNFSSVIKKGSMRSQILQSMQHELSYHSASKRIHFHLVQYMPIIVKLIVTWLSIQFPGFTKKYVLGLCEKSKASAVA